MKCCVVYGVDSYDSLFLFAEINLKIVLLLVVFEIGTLKCRIIGEELMMLVAIYGI